MKTTKTVIVLAALLAGCGGDDTFTAEPDDDPVIVEEPTCKANVTGKLTLANGGSSIQTVMANGVDYGKVNTGAEVTLTLPPGDYSIQFDHIDGSPACMPAFVTVSICSTQHLTCSG